MGKGEWRETGRREDVVALRDQKRQKGDEEVEEEASMHAK